MSKVEEIEREIQVLKCSLESPTMSDKNRAFVRERILRLTNEQLDVITWANTAESAPCAETMRNAEAEHRQVRVSKPRPGESADKGNCTTGCVPRRSVETDDEGSKPTVDFPTISETVRKIGVDENIKFKQIDENTLVFNDIVVKSFPDRESSECTFNTYDFNTLLREGIKQGYMIDFKLIHPEKGYRTFMVLYKRPFKSINWRDGKKSNEPKNVPKRENTDAKTDKCAKTRKCKAPRGVYRNMLTQNELFGYIDDCLHEKPLHIPVTVTSDGKEMTLHGITVYNTYNPSRKKMDGKIHIMMPEDYTYNGMTADEVRSEAEKQGKYVFFIMGTPSSFGYPDVSFAHMFRYPLIACTTHQIVQGYKELHPDARPCDCMRDTGLTRNQVYPNWE